MTKRFSKSITALVAAGATVAGLSMPVAAASKQPGYLDYTANCFDLLLNDPAAHASRCGGVSPAPGGNTLAPTGGGNPDLPPCLLVDLKIEFNAAGERVRVAVLPCIPCVIGGGGGGALDLDLLAMGDRVRVAVAPCPVAN